MAHEVEHRGVDISDQIVSTRDRRDHYEALVLISHYVHITVTDGDKPSRQRKEQPNTLSEVHMNLSPSLSRLIQKQPKEAVKIRQVQQTSSQNCNM